MKVMGVVTRDRFVTWEMKSFHHAAARLGVSLHIIDPRHANIDMTRGVVFDRRHRPFQPDVVLGRVDADCLHAGMAVLSLLENFGIPVLNGARTFWQGRNKHVMSACFIRHGIPHPPSWFLCQKGAWNMIKQFPFPLVMKPIVGAQGKGVRLIRDAKELKAALKSVSPPYYLQQFCSSIVEEQRLIVLHNEVLGAVRRIPAPGQWRANRALGAANEKIPVKDAVGRLAVLASRAVGAQFSGVDIIITPTGPVVLEVNVCTQFYGFYEATGTDVAERVVRSLIEPCRPLDVCEGG